MPGMWKRVASAWPMVMPRVTTAACMGLSMTSLFVGHGRRVKGNVA